MTGTGAKDLIKQHLLRLARITGGFALARLALPRHLRILAYHGLWTTPGFQFGDRLFISPEQFEQRMHWLKRSRYSILDLDEAVDALVNKKICKNSVVITIDDGWRSTYTHMLPILEQFGFTATVYVTTWYVDNQSPILNVALNYVFQRSTVPNFAWRVPGHTEFEVQLRDEQSRRIAALEVNRVLQQLPSTAERLQELREICRLADVPTEPWWSEGQFHLMNREQLRHAQHRGLNIQLHTHRHKVVVADDDVLAGELSDNRSFLAEVCGSDQFYHFAYPNGRYDAAAANVLVNAGIRSAVLTDHGLNLAGSDPYALRRFLDGRSVTQAEFEAYMCGALELFTAARRQLWAARP